MSSQQVRDTEMEEFDSLVEKKKGGKRRKQSTPHRYDTEYVFHSDAWRKIFGTKLWALGMVSLVAMTAGILVWHILSFMQGAFVNGVEKFGLIYVFMVCWTGATFFLFFFCYVFGVHGSNVISKSKKLFGFNSHSHNALASMSFMVFTALMVVIIVPGSMMLGIWNHHVGLTGSYKELFFDSITGLAKTYDTFEHEKAVLDSYTGRICNTLGVNGTDATETIGASTYINVTHMISSHTIIASVVAFTLMLVMLFPESRSKSEEGESELKPRARHSAVFEFVRLRSKSDWSLNGYYSSLTCWLLVHSVFWVFDVLSLSGWLSSGQAATVLFWDRTWLMFVLRFCLYFVTLIGMLAMLVAVMTREDALQNSSNISRGHMMLTLSILSAYCMLFAGLNISWLWVRNHTTFVDNIPIELACRLQPGFRIYNATRVLQVTFGTFLLIPALYTLLMAAGKEVQVSLKQTMK